MLPWNFSLALVRPAKDVEASLELMWGLVIFDLSELL
jgi:hypothetical protein